MWAAKWKSPRERKTISVRLAVEGGVVFLYMAPPPAHAIGQFVQRIRRRAGRQILIVSLSCQSRTYRTFTMHAHFELKRDNASEERREERSSHWYVWWEIAVWNTSTFNIHTKTCLKNTLFDFSNTLVHTNKHTLSLYLQIIHIYISSITVYLNRLHIRYITTYCMYIK